MAEKSIFVLGVALLTWGGVFLYLLRLAAIAKGLETQLKALEARESETRENEMREKMRESEKKAADSAPLSL